MHGDIACIHHELQVLCEAQRGHLSRVVTCQTSRKQSGTWAQGNLWSAACRLDSSVPGGFKGVRQLARFGLKPITE